MVVSIAQQCCCRRDFELIIFITTHVTTEGSAEQLGNLQVVAKSTKEPDGVAVDPWQVSCILSNFQQQLTDLQFFDAVFSDEWKEIMHAQDTTIFMMTCGALINEPAARSALLDVAVE